jgi:hypothetical protein
MVHPIDERYIKEVEQLKWYNRRSFSIAAFGGIRRSFAHFFESHVNNAVSWCYHHKFEKW